jgi:hypothetical protein
VDEWDGLENHCAGNGTEGSNPSPSANVQLCDMPRGEQFLDDKYKDLCASGSVGIEKMQHLLDAPLYGMGGVVE